MTQIEIHCLGRDLTADDGSVEYSHQSKRILVDIFEGEPGRSWASILRKPRRQHTVRLIGNEFYPPSRYGELGRAELAKRYGEPSKEQEHQLNSVLRQNLNLPCKVCRFKLTRHRDDVESAFGDIAANATEIRPDHNGVFRLSLRRLAAMLE
jgi:hypothetical protein